MGRKEDAIEFLRGRNAPNKFVKLMGISFNSVMGYLNQMVGERRIAHYEILLNNDKKSRKVRLAHAYEWD